MFVNSIYLVAILELHQQYKPYNALPNICGEFHVQINKNGKNKYIWDRRPETEQDKIKAKQMARLVAHEMGADPSLILFWAGRGTNHIAQSLHIKEEDRKAHKKFYKKLAHYYINNNLFWEYDYYKIVNYDNEIELGMEPYFYKAYGPLDMNSVLYTYRWDSDSPPWIFCNHYGLISYITAIWSARIFQKKCKYKNYAAIDRMYARGQCYYKSVPSLRKVAKKYGIDTKAKAQLGDKWKQKDTTPTEIYLYMINKAKQQGIL